MELPLSEQGRRWEEQLWRGEGIQTSVLDLLIQLRLWSPERASGWGKPPSHLEAWTDPGDLPVPGGLRFEDYEAGSLTRAPSLGFGEFTEPVAASPTR